MQQKSNSQPTHLVNRVMEESKEVLEKTNRELWELEENKKFLATNTNPLVKVSFFISLKLQDL
jgi:hypothetical protein